MSNREKIMNNCLSQITKKFPDSVIGKYSEIGKNIDIKTISTGSISADWALGGGFARISTILGFPSTGKTTLALTACAKLQKKIKEESAGKSQANILYIDAEYALDPGYAAALGVDMENIHICQPDNGPEGYNIIEMYIQSGVADLVVVDSIAAMLPEEYTEGDVGAAVQIGSMARLTTQGVARINKLSSQHNTQVIFINQYKESTRINTFQTVSGEVGGTTKYAPGGPQKDFYFHQIIEIRRGGQLKQGDEILSNITNMRVLKNKIAPPYRSGEFCITFGKGLDRPQELIGLGLAQKVIKAGGAYYNIYDEEGNTINEKAINGRVNLGKYLEENIEVADRLEQILREKLSGLIDDGKNNIVKLDSKTGTEISKDDLGDLEDSNSNELDNESDKVEDEKIK